MKKIAQIPFDELESVSAPEFQGMSVAFIVNRLVLYAFPIAGLVLLLYLIYGGYAYLTSRGDPKAVQQAQGIITNALIGFIIIFVSYWVVQVVGTIFGLTTLTSIFGNP